MEGFFIIEKDEKDPFLYLGILITKKVRVKK